ncbi:thioredoxin family protein [Oscillochloris sp. ZM17-4]|uniref:protein disulfide oxidoreductase n=1 Tax=Oscillochloris sp. ZM17-4 TaxID=2866714 RepID=UPI001C72A334|nr:thioredoxin family protein [Oscillochloris sp. ZM17-4]MBX0330713.1 thioredoxin family protein [Oscillochloris sp. ZM17-4]
MSYIQEKDRTAIQETFGELRHPVHLALFTSEESGEYSTVAAELLAEVADLSPQISVESVDLVAGADRAAAYGVTVAPTLVVLSGDERADNGLRFLGLPSGYEFVSLLEAIRLAGGAFEVSLQPATRAFLDELHAPMRLQVFVTPTCPYCPRAVVLAYQLAMSSPYILAEGVEVSEFPDMGERYSVMGVPKTVIDGLIHIEGAVPEPMLLARLREALVAEAV